MKEEREKIMSVFESLDLKPGETEEYCYGTEFADLHYQLLVAEEPKLLRIVQGENFPASSVLKKRDYIKRNLISIVVAVVVYIVSPLSSMVAFRSPLWYLIVLTVLLWLLLPRFKEIGVKRKMIPAFRAAGITVKYDGSYHVE